MGKLIHEAGNRYGRLTVFERAGTRGGQAAWLCKCNCGNERIVPGRELRNGNTKSCGCIPRGGSEAINETGNKYGRLVVIKRVKNERHMAAWLCRCDCGKTTVVTGNRLRREVTKSCGCLRSEMTHERCALPSGEAAFNMLYGRMRGGANERNLAWALAKNKVKALTQENCFYCGVEPSQTINPKQCNGSYIYNGLDRLDPSQGYIPDNVVPCCKVCNFAKHTMTIEQFRIWIERIHAHFIEREQIDVA